VVTIRNWRPTEMSAAAAAAASPVPATPPPTARSGCPDAPKRPERAQKIFFLAPLIVSLDERLKHAEMMVKPFRKQTLDRLRQAKRLDHESDLSCRVFRGRTLSQVPALLSPLRLVLILGLVAEAPGDAHQVSVDWRAVCTGQVPDPRLQPARTEPVQDKPA
jgi:hypothetical protein